MFWESSLRSRLRVRSRRDGQLQRSAITPLPPNPHDAKDTFCSSGGHDRENATSPSSETLTQPFSFSFFRQPRRPGMRARERSSMLTSFREHLSERAETELNRPRSAGRAAEISDLAARESRCRDLASTDLHRLQTRAQLFRSLVGRNANTQARHSSGRHRVRSRCREAAASAGMGSISRQEEEGEEGGGVERP